MKTEEPAQGHKMPPPPSLGMEVALKSSAYGEYIARLRDKMVKDISRLQKNLARAHYAVGEIVLGDEALWSNLAPHLEAHLDKLGSARKAVDEYREISAELKRLKNLVP